MYFVELEHSIKLGTIHFGWHYCERNVITSQGFLDCTVTILNKDSWLRTFELMACLKWFVYAVAVNQTDWCSCIQESRKYCIGNSYIYMGSWVILLLLICLVWLVEARGDTPCLNKWKNLKKTLLTLVFAYCYHDTQLRVPRVKIKFSTR